MPAAAGLAAVLAGLGAGELVAVVVARAFSPLLVVGEGVIDLTPGPMKEAVIHAFGGHDKQFLFVVLGVVVAVIAALAGVLEARRPWLGRALVLVGGALGVAAALTRADATPVAALPSVATGVIGAWALVFLIRHIPPERAPRAGLAPSRREFLGWSIGAAAIGLIATVTGTLLTRAAGAAATARQAFRLPRARTSAPPVPATASFDVPGITPVVTANGDFYRTDIELAIPQLDPAQWSLKVHGMVERPFTLDWNELTALPMEEHYVTLACVSNEVGGPLISNAKWLGYPVRLLLERAGVTGDADMVFSESFDGWTAATPLSALNDPDRAALLAVGMNGEPLPFVHGFPARLVVPGLYGYVSATKWVVDLLITRFADHTSYWTSQGWAEQGPIKQESRIDVPRAGASVAAGPVWVAGVAWDQHVGVAKVEVQVDDGPWQTAELAHAISADTWVQWRWRWDAAAGQHRLKVRSTNTQGQLQTSAYADVLPSGATGWHTIDVTVR
ncbi:MAG: molybdopterin-dependent oxidoreductase [Microbacteriaceae bacterium]|nr:molybdopterin-dependent oxidoreductase [Microbacteriaceae bacterium]MCL2794239.1 molybdopterin-dependent oxidoreductase [Microbacteriaceae bacterium]